MRLGTIGTSWITEKFIEAAKEFGRLELNAVYSRSQDKAEAFAEKHGAVHAFTDLEEMAESDAIDIVYIASPNALHFEQAIVFLKNKKHVICEKPIFTSLQELNEAYRLADEHGVHLFEAMRNLHHPNFSNLKNNVDRAGKITSAFLHRVRYSSKYEAHLRGEEPNVSSKKFGGGALMDLGVYPLALAVALFGRPSGMSYHAHILNTGVDGSGTLLLEYPDFVCTIMCSKIATSYNRSEIHGDKGTISIDDVGDLDSIQFRGLKDDEFVELGEEQLENDMVYEIKNFTKIIRTNDQAEYERLRKISRDVLEVVEAVRV